MSRERRLKLNFIWIQLYYFFRSFIFAYVIERLFWRSRGISISDTVYIEIIYSVVLVMMEIPTGIWADRWSRKRMISLGAILSLIGGILMVKAKGFGMFAIIIGMSGVSGALTSGSVSALLYDSLKELGKTLNFEAYLARIKGIRYSSGLMAGLMGAHMASEHSLLIPYQWSIVSLALMTVMTFLMVEPKRHYSEGRMTAKEIFSVSRKVLLTSDFLKYVMLVGATIGAAVIYIEEFWQNYFDALTVDVAMFGVISGAMSLTVILASLFTERVSRRLASLKRKQITYTYLMVVCGGAFMVLAWIKHPVGLVFMLMALFGEALVDTIVLGDIHHGVGSEYRATMESIYAMLSNLASISIGLAFAWFADRFSVFWGFMAIGCIIFLMTILKQKYKFKTSKIQRAA